MRRQREEGATVYREACDLSYLSLHRAPSAEPLKTRIRSHPLFCHLIIHLVMMEHAAKAMRRLARRQRMPRFGLLSHLVILIDSRVLFQGSLHVPLQLNSVVYELEGKRLRKSVT